MNSKKLYIWSAFVVAAVFVLFAIGTLFDLKVSEILYARDNAFGKIYEAAGKMPAFVIAVFACFALGENAKVNEKNNAKKIVFYILAYLARILNFIDLGEMLLGSKLYAAAVGAVLSVPLCVTAFFALKDLPSDKLLTLKKWAIVALFTVALIAVLVFVLKTIWGRARYVDTQTGDARFTPWYKLVRTGGDSFPSGHAALGGTLFLLLPLCGILDKFKGKEKSIFVVALVFVAVVMISRISDGHHYLSDVAAGFGIAFVVEVIVMRVSYGKKLDKMTLNKDNNKIERLLDAIF